MERLDKLSKGGRTWSRGTRLHAGSLARTILPCGSLEAREIWGMIAKIVFLPGRRDEMIEVLMESAAGMPECLSYVVAKDAADENTIWVTQSVGDHGRSRRILVLACRALPPTPSGEPDCRQRTLLDSSGLEAAGILAEVRRRLRAQAFSGGSRGTPLYGRGARGAICSRGTMPLPSKTE